jgi:DNA-binding NtrC family response regulator
MSDLWHSACSIFSLLGEDSPKIFTLADDMRSSNDDIEQKAVLIVNADPEESACICRLLQEADYTARTLNSLAELKNRLSEKSCIAIIMDIDSAAVDNRTIRDLASAFPTIPFLCISKERFHPQLRDSIRNHIYACLTKPIDSDELRYWLRCIRKDDREPTVG